MFKKHFEKGADHKAAVPKKLSDTDLLDLVQRRTLAYFTDFAHPASGMARERSNVVQNYGYNLDCVTSGGTGFGIMAMIAGTSRGWLKPDDTLDRVTKIVDFLETTEKYHGAFPHFMNGNTGKTIPFSEKDDGGDLVETSFLIMGLLTARQYFANNPKASDLCDRINTIWKNVEWDWYTKNNSDTLYWHWSPNHGWDMDLPVTGWNESLITHVLANASPTHPVPNSVYEQSWLKSNDFKNGQDHGGIVLPLGPDRGGPLFLSHYSFMGLNPKGMTDAHADYWQQNRNHVLINRAHCIQNPHGYKGYGENCWGLTASDDHNGYAAHAPDNDTGVISPTAALSSFPYTPRESMQALRYFYEEKGDKIFGKYGFKDAFNETEDWIADSHLAIDQGPIVVMIENYRSGLLWKLFMSCPEIKHGLDNLGFKTPVAKPSITPPGKSP
jgi:hypothetical protein